MEVEHPGRNPSIEQDEFSATTARLLRREALRRAAAELNTTSGPGLESMLEKISAEVTAEAAEKRDVPTPEPKPLQSHPSTP
jgi:hypothetical protein